MCSNSHQVSCYISSGETLPSTAFVNKLISLLSHCASCPLPSVPFPHLAFWNQSFFLLCLFLLSLSLFSLCLCFVSVFLSQFLSITLSLCFSLSVCLSGIIWLVLIYSHHYLVLGEDKHAFACLMNQTPSIPLSMGTHTCTRVHRYIHAHARTHAHTLLPLALQSSVSLPLTWSRQLLTPRGVNRAYLSTSTSTAGWQRDIISKQEEMITHVRQKQHNLRSSWVIANRVKSIKMLEDNMETKESLIEVTVYICVCKIIKYLPHILKK